MHSRKPFCESLFSSSVALLIMSVASQKHCTFNALFPTREEVKNQLEPGQESMGHAAVLSRYSLLRNP
jgi:hypothetical protein